MATTRAFSFQNVACASVIFLACPFYAFAKDLAPFPLLSNVGALVKNHQHHEEVEHTVVMVLFLAVLAVSLVFEFTIRFLTTSLRARKLENLEPILNGIYKELTILGFISLTVYTLVHSGVVQPINDRLFGVSETEKVAIHEALKEGKVAVPPTTLQEAFEGIHILVFIIMTVFLVQGAVLLIVGYRAVRSFRSLDEKEAVDLRNDVLDVGNNPLPPSVKKSLEFYAFKQRFLHPREMALSKPKTVARGFSNFSFTDYLTVTFSNTLKEIVELPTTSLVCLLIVAVLLRPAMDLSGIDAVLFTVFAAVGLLIITSVLYRYFSFWERLITPDIDVLTDLLINSVDVAVASNPDALVAPIDSKPIAQRNILNKLCNRTEIIIPFGKPEYLQRLVQIIMALHAAYLAILIQMIFSFKYKSVWLMHGIWAYPLSLGIILLSLSLWTLVIRKYAFVSSLDFLVSYSAIRQVEASQDRHDLEIDTRVFQYLLLQIEKSKFDSIGDMSRTLTDYSNLDEATKRTVERGFMTLASAMGTSGSRNLENLAIQKRFCFEFFRAVNHCGGDEKRCFQSVDTWFNALDTAKVSHLTMDQFKALVMLVSRFGVVQEDIAQNNKQKLQIIFKQMDIDDSGTVDFYTFSIALRGLVE